MILEERIRAFCEELRLLADEQAKVACDFGERLRTFDGHPWEARPLHEKQDSAMGRMNALGWARRQLLALLGDVPPGGAREPLMPGGTAPAVPASPRFKVVGTCGHVLDRSEEWEPGDRMTKEDRACADCEGYP